MIGVVADPSDITVICEFFELFKTPWERHETGRHYDVVLCAGDVAFPKTNAGLVVIYAGRRLALDPRGPIEMRPLGSHGRILRYQEKQIPIYGSCLTFREGTDDLVDESTGHPVVHLAKRHGKTIARIGYDLFEEVRTLLLDGQPIANAAFPTLDLHISLLRHVIVTSGVPMTEIPPVPDGYRFTVCLTHDVDHPSIRQHRLDHTVLGFLARALVGSLVKTLKGHLPTRDLFKNWVAALKLPLVQLGLARDFWCDFDHYVQLECGRCSTFFVIPFKGRPGLRGSGQAPRRRASAYGAADIADKIRCLMSQGSEVGLHGIDAWRDGSGASAELDRIRQLTARRDTGVRMHWLYFDTGSPPLLDRAGADYDSTIGYNETVGYRAGTSQVYRPVGATRLLELPLHIMDTALFFPSHLNLSFAEARKRVAAIIENAVEFGGVITVNWHDRSIAPERCWGGFYEDLLSELDRRGAWFATGGEAVAWFRKRRAISFDGSSADKDAPLLSTAGEADGLPGLQLRAYEGRPTALDHAGDCKA
jgi:hypothetical protein